MQLIDDRIKRRACNAIKLLPFNGAFYFDVKLKGMDSESVFENKTKYFVKGKSWFSSSYAVEDSFCWLIGLGILRREVDGQGLTSKIRLTPLGRQILERYPDLPLKRINFLQKIINCFVSRFYL